MRIKTLGMTAGAVAGAVAATAIAGGAATSREVGTRWLCAAAQAELSASTAGLPIVWPVLYGDIALVSADTIDRLTKDGSHGAARRFSTALAVNLVLNASWSWIFSIATVSGLQR